MLTSSLAPHILNPHHALRLNWIAFAMMIVTVGLGRAWDGWWHATNLYDSFFSPPHIFVYTMTILNLLLVAPLALTPEMRRPLVIVVGGFGLLGIAGLGLDNLWHTTFGLNETLWSAPHSMLNWAWFITALGFLGGRLALTPYRPPGRLAAVVMGLLILGFSVGPFLGPLHQNNTPDTVRLVASIPAFAVQPAAQRTYQIYLAWNLTRASPLLVPLGALWAGSALALIRGIDGRMSTLLSAATLWTLLAALGDYRAALALDQLAPVSSNPANWWPIPILPAALVLVSLKGKLAWPLAGLAFGLSACLIWGAPPRLAALAAPAMLAGLWLGRQLYEAVLHHRAGPLLLLAAVAPLMFGLVDLYFRVNT